MTSQKLQVILITLVAVPYSVFHIYTASAGIIPGFGQRIIHLAFALTLAFLMYPAARKLKSPAWRVLDITLIVAVLSVSVYGFLEGSNSIADRAGNPNLLDQIESVILVALVLEAARRVYGFILPLVAVVAILYAVFGYLLPGVLYHRSYEFARMTQHITFSSDGILGVPTAVSAAIIAIFVIFGAILESSGGGRLFLDFAKRVVGKVRGGPAKISVVGSSLFGMLSGSSSANVAVTGTFTIPLMKKSGFSASRAAAVEAVASTGGQLMPPVMGAAVFIMAEFVGRPYLSLIQYAFIPVILYYIGLFLFVDSEAVTRGIHGLKREEIPGWLEVIRRAHLLVPVAVLIWLFVSEDFSPERAAAYAIFSIILVSLGRRVTRMSPWVMMTALSKGGKAVINVALACACAGIVIGVVSLTGLGFKISSLLISLSGGNLFLLLFYTMLASIILGMGMPTVGCYIILAILVVPVLVNSGVNLIAAHFFVFYFGVISNITPPVAIAAYVAAGIAGAKPMATAIRACTYGITGLIVPYLFVLSPALLLQGSLAEVLTASLAALVGLVVLVGAISGCLLRRLRVWVRLAMAAGAILLIWAVLMGGYQ